ncbi:glycerophosphodiester phosphodiesterase family protein [Runella zeae]|uniref:glycerophosphodiester phosphodiesterase family protein n=1 Tax=Runella zeae TaxID=94255 RepID=UPI000425F6B5|nr:glycerophosphodiester phosphodiesterase family protein [Runella zeae]
MKSIWSQLCFFWMVVQAVFAQTTPASLPQTQHKFVVIAHRGNHQHVPENTLASYEDAIKAGTDYVEIDLRTSKDGVLMIHHDATVDRMTDGKGLVKDLTWAELSALNIKKNQPSDAHSYRIPTFKEVLKLCKGRIHIYLDFKEADVAQTWQEIQAEGMEKQVVVYINKIPQYKQWRSIAPQIPLMTSLTEAINTPEKLGFFLGQAKLEVLDNISDQGMLEVAHRNGIAVWLDVQNPSEGPEMWQSALQKGVDGVQTDHPEDLVKYLNENKLREGIRNNNAAVLAAKPSYRAFKDIAYGEAPGKDNLLDAYFPENHNAQTKVVVYIHGGSWSRGDKSEFPEPLIQKLVGEKGYALVSINYRLVKDGKNRFPAQIEDVKKAISFITDKAKRYQYNGKEFAIIGASAGAHLALLYAYGHDQAKQVKTVLDLWGPTDLSDKSVRADGSDANNTVINFLGEADPKAQICLDASPAYHLTKETGVPTLIFHGGEDPLVHVSQAQNLHKKLDSLGIVNHLEIYTKEKHGMSADAAVDVFAKMVEWLEKYYPAVQKQ